MTPRAVPGAGGERADVHDGDPAGDERFARAIVDTIREPLLVLDGDLRVESANPAFYRHFRVTPEETLDRSFFSLGSGQWDVPVLRAVLETVIPEHAEVRDVEVEHDFPGLGRRTMLVNARQVQWEGHAYRLVLVALEDVTEQRRAERALARSSRELQRSNRELEEFAHAASHDLQEPLRKIGAFSDRLATEEGDRLGEQSRLYLERIQAAVVRMQTRIDDLLELARVGRERPSPEPVDLRAIVDSALDQLGALLPPDAEVGVGTLPGLEADPLRMELLFQNLLGNSIKYRRTDTPLRIEVSGEVADPPVSAEGPWVRLTVRDNGIGFDPEYSERIFGAFQRLHGRTEYEGSGVGLSICRRVVEQHGGTITAHGQPGEGARFEITLPAVQPSDEDI